ncbi:hypothetical protein F4779DRAFT_571083 [Xylariaceae sp. FL0662B]|nr:hypothetical protein F4779DRAFT_571083 [Xylariaceae sp. FL0662B]
MHTSFFILSLAGIAYGLPTLAVDKRSPTTTSPDVYATADAHAQSSSSSSSAGSGLINISPDISPDLHLSDKNSCLGLGISVCDPINVGGTQNSNNGGDGSSTTEKAASQPDSSNSGGGSLINLSPTISPDLDLDDSDSCLGIGISACDPINVNGTQNSNNE